LNTKTFITSIFKKAFKKGLKKSSLKAIKKKAIKESSRGLAEDIETINK